MVLFRTFRLLYCPLFLKPISWLGLFCRFLQQDSSSIYNIDFIPIVTHRYILYNMTCSNPAATYMFIFYQEIRAIYVHSKYIDIVWYQFFACLNFPMIKFSEPVCIFTLSKAMSKYTCSEEWVQVLAAVYLGDLHKLCKHM